MVALTTLSLMACDKSEPSHQLGKYAESGESSRTVDNVEFVTLRGNKLGIAGQIVGPREHLLYLAICLPKAMHRKSSSSSGVRGVDLRMISSAIHSYVFEEGLMVSIQWKWDREKDRVTIGAGSFDRGVGNIFLIDIDEKGIPKVEQSSAVMTEVVPDGEEVKVVRRAFPDSDRLKDVDR